MSSEATLAAYKAARIAEMKAQSESPPPVETPPAEKGTSWFTEDVEDTVDKEIEQAEEELQYEEKEVDESDVDLQDEQSEETSEDEQDTDDEENAESEDSGVEDDDSESEDEDIPVEKKSGKGFEKSLERKMRKIARLEAELRAYQSGQAQPAQQKAPVQDLQPDPRNYQNNFQQYTADLAAWAARQAVAQHEYNKTIQERQKVWDEQVKEIKKVASDYDEVMDDFKHQFSWVNIPGLNEAIIESPVSAKLWYHLGTNTEEAERIFRLPPHRALVEIGKIEDRLIGTKSAPVEVKKVSKAPKPTSSEKGKAVAPKGLKDLAKEDGNDLAAQRAYREQRLQRRPRY